VAKDLETRSERAYREKIVEDIRPWGRFRSYPLRAVGSVKIITVDPGAAPSLQYHKRRGEFWVILDRGLEVTLGERTWRPKPGEEVYVPRGAPHRLRCLGRRPGRVLELWLGKSSEADIIRLADDYGRVR
jgi:mannose-1-phosphate guanylyltransferase/mannose-6-phosphate isomerase/mannose-1-phosphate guanylyltransferase/mannose-6-phosphate isomerase